MRSGVDSKARRGKTNSSDTSSNDDGSDDSSDDSSSESSSSSASDSDIAPDDPTRLAKKAQKKAELLQRISDKVSSSSSPPNQPEDQLNPGSGILKRSLEDSVSSNLVKRPRVTTDPPTDDAFIAAVKKYLMRKPITVADLLKKIRSKRLIPASQCGRGTGSYGGTDDVAESMLANALRQLRPLKHMVNGQPVLSLKR